MPLREGLAGGRGIEGKAGGRKEEVFSFLNTLPSLTKPVYRHMD